VAKPYCGKCEKGCEEDYLKTTHYLESEFWEDLQDILERYVAPKSVTAYTVLKGTIKSILKSFGFEWMSKYAHDE